MKINFFPIYAWYVSIPSYIYVVLLRESIFGVYFALQPSVLAKRQIFGDKLIFFQWKIEKKKFSKYMHDRCLYLQFLTLGIDFWCLFWARTFRFGEKPNFRRKTDFSTKKLKNKIFFKYMHDMCIYQWFFIPRIDFWGLIWTRTFRFGEMTNFRRKTWFFH